MLNLFLNIKGEGDTAWEAEAQLYSDNIDLKIMQVKVYIYIYIYDKNNQVIESVKNQENKNNEVDTW